MELTENSGVIVINFAAELVEGGSQCLDINAATSTGQTPKISVSYIIGSSRQVWVTELAVVFRMQSYNLQYGGFGVNCSGFNRIGYWPSKYNLSSATGMVCTFLTSQGSTVNLSLGFTSVCIFRAYQSSCVTSSQESTWYSGQLMISGFSTITTLSTASVPPPPCVVIPQNVAKSDYSLSAFPPASSPTATQSAITKVRPESHRHKRVSLQAPATAMNTIVIGQLVQPERYINFAEVQLFRANTQISPSLLNFTFSSTYPGYPAWLCNNGILNDICNSGAGDTNPTLVIRSPIAFDTVKRLCQGSFQV
eukprot:gene26553-35221_t